MTENQDKGYQASNSISASRISTPIMDLPFSISAFTPQFISDIDAHDLTDIVRYASGVTLGAREFNQGNTSYVIRGFTQSPEHDGFYETAQGNVYVDAVDIERVEVVKGPASLLYGQINPGGTVNYITKRPEATPFTDVTLEGGSYDYARATVDINAPLIGQTLMFRLNAAYTNDFEYAVPSKSKTTVIDPTVLYNITPNVSLKVNYQYFYRNETPPAVYLPGLEVADPASIVNSLYGVGSPSPSGVFSGNYGPDANAGYNDGSDLGLGHKYPGEPATFNYDGASDFLQTHLSTLNAELDVKMGEHWVGRADFNYNHNSSIQQQTGISVVNMAPPGSLDFTAGKWVVDPVWAALTPAQQLDSEYAFAQQVVANPNAAEQLQNGTPAPAVMARRKRWTAFYGNVRTIQTEAAGDYDFSWGKIKPLVGLYFDQTYSYLNQYQIHASATTPYFQAWDIDPSSPSYYVNNNTSFSLADLNVHSQYNLAYVSDQAAYGVINGSFLNDRLYLVAGVRYNRSESNTTNFLGGPGSIYGRGYYANYTTPQVGAGFKVTKDTLIYASYSTSYTLPSQSYLSSIEYVNGVAESVPSKQAVPTIGQGGEVGIKTNYLDGRISSTLAFYQEDQTNVPQEVDVTIDGNSYSTETQGNKVRSRGVEYEITYSPMDNLQVFASVSEDDVRNIAEPVGYSIYLGVPPQGTAKTLANLWTRYTFTSSPIKGVWVGGGFNYTSKVQADASNPYLFQAPYWLFNSAIGYDWTWEKVKMGLTANWENMGNKYYVPGALQARGLPERVTIALHLHF